MISQITLDRSNARHAEVLDVLEILADELGSATNAAVQCIKNADRYVKAKAQLDCQNNPNPDGANDNGNTT